MSTSNAEEELAIVKEVTGVDVIDVAQKLVAAIQSKTPEPVKVTVSKGKDWKSNKWIDFGFEAEIREDKIANLAVQAAVDAGWSRDEIYAMKTVRIGDYLHIFRGDGEI